MERIEELNSKIKALIELSNNAQQKKEEVINLVKKLASQLSSGKISRREYYDKIGDALKLKSPEEWIKYYDNYIADCKLKIIQCKQLIREEESFGKKEGLGKVLKFLVLIVFIGVIISLIYNFGPTLYNSFKPAEVANITGGEIYSYKPVSIVSKNPNANFVENTKQGSAIVGKNVKWKSEIEMKSKEDFSINLPDSAKVLSIKDETGKEITDTKDLVGGNKYSVEFETIAPKISEEILDKDRERVVVSSPVHYQEVYSFIKISEKLDLKKSNIGKLKLYQIENIDGKENKVPTQFFSYDTDEDGIIDKAEWITPHLSDAVFEFVIINITKAEHLNSKREFISDIYEEVKTKDGIWSEAINDNEYVRVNFEHNLTNKNDITIYARMKASSVSNETENSKNAEIEVYRKGDSNLIAKFESITNESWYKIYLTNLAEGENQESFDLKILNNPVEIDYIVDPTGTAISSCDELKNIGGTTGTCSNNYYLTQDIDCTDVTIISLCNSPTFTGILDGNYSKIYNLTITGGNKDGLFSILGIGARIKNLALVNVTVNCYSGGTACGAFAGESRGGNIDNCSVAGIIKGGETADPYVGGFVGYVSGTYLMNITNSYSDANVSGGGCAQYIGGFVGDFGGYIINSYFSGNVSAVDNCLINEGGLVGRGGTINNSYSVGAVYGTPAKAGALSGGSTTKFRNSYWYDYPGDSATSCVAGGTNPTGCTQEITPSNFYLSNHNVYDAITPFWDFTNIWKARSSDYPIFQWQNLVQGNSPTGMLCGAKNSGGTGIVCENNLPCPPGFSYTYISSWGGVYRFYHCYANQNLEVIPSGTLCGFANYNSVNGWSSEVIKCNGYSPKDSICPSGYGVQSVPHTYSGTTDTQYYCVKSVSDSSPILPGTLCGRTNYYWSNYPNTPAIWIWSSSILCQDYDPQNSCPASYARMNSVHHGGIDLDYFCVYNPNNINFIPPTPGNNEIITKNYAEINVSAPVSTVGTLKSFLFNWKDVNYTIYNESLVLMMNFDNNPNIGEGGSTAVDVSQYGLTGTLRNSVAWDSNGKFGGCINSEHVDGSEVLINGVNVNTVSGKKNTVAFWMYWEGYTGGSHMPFGWDDNEGYDLIIYNAASGGSPCFGFNTGEGDCIGVSPTSPIPLANKWIYVTAIFNNQNCLNNELYINGVKQTIGYLWHNKDCSSRTATSKVHIGGWGESAHPTAYKFGGLIDELRIWNRGLSNAEIQELYMSNLQKYNSTQWYFYVNQTDDATTPLQNGISYDYYACDKIPNENCTETRTVATNSDTIFPQINFTYPTPANNTNTINTSVQINVSISEDNLNEVKFNWNGTNFTVYNDSLLLMMNFDNVSSIGEKYNNSNGTVIADLSKYANNGTLFVGVARTGNYTNGKYGGAYNFDGKDDYVNCKNSSTLKSQKITISAWIKLNKYPPSGKNSFILEKNLANSWVSYGLWINSSGHLLFAVENNSPSPGAYPTWSPKSPLNLGTWYHVTGVFNKIYNNYQDGNVYINGTLVPINFNANYYGSTFAIGYDGGNVSIGREGGTINSNYFNGTIDEVRIWNRSLSSDEIYEQYISNFNKYNSNQWYFYINQSRNATNGLDSGDYSYFASAKDSSGNENMTETRFIQINAITDVYDCRILNQANTVYILKNDIEADRSPCINISAENITLNCMGHKISVKTEDSYNLIYSNYTNTIIINCSLSVGVPGSSNYGIFLDVNASNSSIINDTMGMNMGMPSSFLIISSNNNNISFNYMSGMGPNIIFKKSDNNFVSNNYLSSEPGQFLQLTNSSNNIFLDSKFDSSFPFGPSVSLISDGTGVSYNNTFINCSYNGSTESVDSGSQLIRKWYYRAYVNDTWGNKINNTNVSAYNSSENFHFSILTNSSGWTNITTITDYVNDGVKKNYYSDYTINATNTTLRDEHTFDASLGNNLNDVFTLGASTEVISACKVLKSPNKVYTLVADIVAYRSPCIKILAPNITLNCMGHSISPKVSENYDLVYSNYANTTIINCTLATGDMGNFNYGIFLDRNANNSRIINNSINNFGDSLIISSNNNNISFNYIYSFMNVNVFFKKSDNNFVSNNYLSGGNCIILQLTNSSNNIFLDSKFESSETIVPSVSLVSDGAGVSYNNTFINCTYNNSLESVSSGSQLIRKWYYRAYVKDMWGKPVNNANVSAYNKSDSQEFSMMTNSALETSNTDSGLVLLMHMNNDSNVGENSTNVYDYSGNGNNGTVYDGNTVCGQTGTCPQWGLSYGKLGAGGWSLDGINDYINIQKKLIENNSRGTYSFWVYANPNSNLNYQVILAQEMGGVNKNLCYALYYYSTTNIIYYLYSNGGAGNGGSYNYDLKNKWTHLTASWNQSTSKLYINGVLVSSGAGPFCTQTPSENFMIGEHPWLSSNSYFNGSIDEVAIWNKSLSDSEVLALYQRQVGGYTNVTSITDYVNNGTLKNYYSNYTINATNVTLRDEHTFNASLGNNLNDVFILGMKYNPQIFYVEPIPNIVPLSGGVRNVVVNFSVYDVNGYLDINSSSARVNFSKNGIVRQNTSCKLITGNGNYANYSCNVSMWFFDSPGFWNINVFIADNEKNIGFNDTTSFNYNPLWDWNMIPGSLNWSNLIPGISNQLADNNLTIYNYGNVNISQIMINSTNLAGEKDNTYNISAGNFSIDGCGTKRMIENQYVLSSLTINYTQSTVNLNASGNLTFCVKDPIKNIAPQSYISIRDWNIDVTFALAAFALKRKRRKKKKIDNELLIALEKNKQEIINSLTAEIKKIGKKIIPRERILSEEIKFDIPIEIFKNKLGAAEALVKYLHENEKLKFSEIAKLINRDQRTVWVDYNNSLKSGKIEIQKSGLQIPLKVFSDRRLSIFESLVKYLRENGYKNSEIAEILNKDQRNIGTFYSRALRKIA